MPKVSVIIPVYGVEKYIERCARSLFEQTLDDIEYLFIDDCTPDKSIEILRRVLEDYPHRKPQTIIHRMEQNSGQAKVREWGIKHVIGEYVIHCDSDDWTETNMYERLYTTALDTDSEIVFCEHYDTDGHVYKKSKHVVPDNKIDMMFSFPTLWEKLVKRTLFTRPGVIFPQGNMGEDKALSVQVMWFAQKWAYVDDALYYYFLNPCSISNVSEKDKSLQRFEMSKQNVSTVERFIKENNIADADRHLDVMRKRSLDWLVPFLKDQDMLSLYRNAFPGLHKRLAYNNKVSSKEKIQFYLNHFGL